MLKFLLAQGFLLKHTQQYEVKKQKTKNKKQKTKNL